MDKGRIVKWLYKGDDFTLYILASFDIVINKKGRGKSKLYGCIKRHQGKLAMWIYNSNNNGWKSNFVEDAAEIREKYKIPLSDVMLELYDALLIAENLKN